MPGNLIPWDIYIDERKVKGHYRLGFLTVPNTPSFMHKLFLCRHHPADEQGRTIESTEVHWNEPHARTLPIVMKWIDCLFQHNGARFYM